MNKNDYIKPSNIADLLKTEWTGAQISIARFSRLLGELYYHKSDVLAYLTGVSNDCPFGWTEEGFTEGPRSYEQR